MQTIRHLALFVLFAARAQAAPVQASPCASSIPPSSAHAHRTQTASIAAVSSTVHLLSRALTNEVEDETFSDNFINALQAVPLQGVSFGSVASSAAPSTPAPMSSSAAPTLAPGSIASMKRGIKAQRSARGHGLLDDLDLNDGGMFGAPDATVDASLSSTVSPIPATAAASPSAAPTITPTFSHPVASVSILPVAGVPRRLKNILDDLDGAGNGMFRALTVPEDSDAPVLPSATISPSPALHATHIPSTPSGSLSLSAVSSSHTSALSASSRISVSVTHI